MAGDGDTNSKQAGANLEGHLQGTGRSITPVQLAHSDKHIADVPAEAVAPEVARRLLAFCEDLTSDCASIGSLLDKLVGSHSLGGRAEVVKPLKYLGRLIQAAKDLTTITGDHALSKTRENASLPSSGSEYVLRYYIGIFRTPGGEDYAKSSLGDKAPVYFHKFVPVYRVYTNKAAREALQDLLIVLEGIEKFTPSQLEEQVLSMPEGDLVSSPLLAKAKAFNLALYNAVGQSNMHISSTMVTPLDKIAQALESAGLTREAAELDSVANAIESELWL